MLSGALEASKALLEEQLEAAQERCARLHETQRENLLLRTRLGEAHAVRPPGHSVIRDLRGPRVLWWSLTPTACFLCVCVHAHSVMSDSVQPHRL